MKKKELTQLRSKSLSDLIKMVDKKKAEFYNSYVSVKAAGEKNVKKAKNLRHEISQILTVIKEREILDEIENEKAESEAANDKKIDKSNLSEDNLSDKAKKVKSKKTKK